MVLSWTPIIFAILVTACLTLAAVHLIVSLKVRQTSANLLLSLGASAALAAIAFFEVSMMHAETPAEYGAALRWLHVPVFMFILAVVGFVLFHLRVGRWWLALTACTLRAISLLLNFLVGENLNYFEITRLQQLPFLGDSVSIAVGIPNPLMLVGQLSLLLLLIFIVDATISLWRRGERERALVFGGCIVFVIVTPALMIALVVQGALQWPPIVSWFFFPLVAVMSYEMSRDMVRSAWLAAKLQATGGELRLSEQRLKLATEGAQLAVWEWNTDRDEIWITEQGFALFGFARGERVNFSSFLNKVHPKDRDDLQEAIARSRRDGDSYEREYRIVLPDGQIRWIAARGKIDAGAGALSRGIAFDITEAKWAEERFQRVVEASPYGMIIANAEGSITYANPRTEAYFGYSSPELTGRSIEALLPGYRQSASADPVGTSGDRPVEREITGRRKDGSEFPLQVGLSEIPGFDGKMRLTTLLDISERKQREEQLWREKTFLKEVIDSNPCLIFVKDIAGRFTLANQTVAALYGATPRELIGKTDADFNGNAEEVEAFRRADRAVLASQLEQFIAEERITDATGKRHWLQTIKRPIKERDGTANQVLGVSTDITARKNKELEIERQRNELAHLSRVTMLSELSGSLAHELNQPLAAILSNAQAALRFLAHGKSNLGEVSDILRDIVEDDRRAGGIIQGLRLLLKKGEMRQEPLDLNEAVRSVLKLMRSDMLNAEVSVSTALASDLPKVSGDRVQLQQVLLNLLVNGCEAMSGEAVVDRELIVTTELDADGLVQISVADQGHGIASEDLEQVFEPFITTKAEGLGLGLAVCRRIIEAHGGRMWATDSAGRGACFRFTVPAHSGETN